MEDSKKDNVYSEQNFDYQIRSKQNKIEISSKQNKNGKDTSGDNVPLIKPTK